jgi:type IV pilus assembly protein PilN
MIKINLLEVERARRPKTVAAPGGVPTTLLALIILGATAAIFIFYYIAIGNRLTNLTRDVEEKRIRKKELEPYIKRVDELEQRKNELAKKNHAIEELRSRRTIPVHILDEVSRALPEQLWLTTMEIKGETLNIDGATLQEQAIPTFMKTLDASEFIGTCSLIETRQQPTPSSPGGRFTVFRITAPITNPFKPKPVPPAPTKRS